MKARVRKLIDAVEFETVERCFIAEVANDEEDQSVSIARARVKPGISTAWHSLKGVSERYIIIKGKGLVEVSDLPPTRVDEGDVVRIPAGEPQRISNVGEGDLIFFVVCNPRFTPDCYIQLDDDDFIRFDTHFR